MFVKVLKNGEAQKTLLIYSESLGKVFCGLYLLFNCAVTNSLASTVYNDWKNNNAIFNQLENSNSQKQSILRMNDGKNNNCRIDKHAVF